MAEEVKRNGNKSYIFYVVVLITVLMILGITVSYAFINVMDSTHTSTTTTVGGKTECININLSETAVTSLQYNYPISDTFAASNITPVKIVLNNTCSGQNPINYSLIMTNLTNSSATYIPASKIKIRVTKSGATADLIGAKLLNGLTTLKSTTTTYTYLMDKLNATGSVTAGYTKTPYVIESSTLASGASVTYSAYLWIDHGEGGTNNSTSNQTFKSIFSIVVNNPETLS